MAEQRGLLKRSFDRILAAFLTGILFLLPLVLTFMIFEWLVRQFGGIFGPESLIGSALSGGSTLIFGGASWGVWVLLAVLITAIGLIGLYIQTRARRSIERRLDALINRVPVLRGIYRPVSQLVRMLGKGDHSELSAMRVVSCRFGENGADVLALLASPKPVMVAGAERMIVYLPSAPLPMTGGLVLVPPASVIPVDGVAVDDLLKLYVSLGTISPDSLRGE